MNPAQSWQGELSGRDSLGDAIAGTGDVNGDGLDDISMSFSRHDGTGQNRVSSLRVFHGNATSLATTANVTLAEPEVASAYTRSPATARDINGDGFSDFVVGGPGLNPIGAVQVYHGSLGGLGTTSVRAIPRPASESSFAQFIAMLAPPVLRREPRAI